MRTNIDNYVAVHGSSPRGFGSWLFEITMTDGRGRYLTEIHRAAGTMAEARRYAIRDMKSMCGAAKTVVEIVVLP